MYRLGVIGSRATPPVRSGVHRSSFMGQLSFADDRQEEQVSYSRESQAEDMASTIGIPPRVNSGLQLSSADPTRSSFIASSTFSRMSGLSDFPAPPRGRNAEHISLSSAYFDGTLSQSEGAASAEHLTRHLYPVRNT